MKNSKPVVWFRILFAYFDITVDHVIKLRKEVKIMATEYISLYYDNPTVNGTDGTKISYGDDTSSPLYVTLEITAKETKYIKMAVRTESGYETTGDTVISFLNDTKARWSICADDNYDATSVQAATFSSSLTISDAITHANKIFWIKVAIVDGDEVANDKTVQINLNTTVKASE